MSETAVVENSAEYTPNEQLIRLLPEEILTNPKFNIRSGAVRQDDLTDEELRTSLKIHGQGQPILLRRVDEGYEIVAGHRRREQIGIINLTLEDGMEPMLVTGIVKDLSDAQALALAAAENLQRKNMNPMEDAALIQKIREEFKWKGGKNSKKVAEFLGKSPGWVTEREKLLALEEPIQADIQAGKLSAEAALVLPAVRPEMRGEVLAEAQMLQMAEKAKKGQKAIVKDGRIEPIKAKHIKAAARKKKALKPGEFKALNKNEILDLFAGYRNSVPHLYKPVQEFIIYLIDSFAAGKGSIRTAESKFDAMIAPVCKGEKCEPEQDEVKEPKKKPAKAAKVKAAKPAKKVKTSGKAAKKPAAKKAAVKKSSRKKASPQAEVAEG